MVGSALVGIFLNIRVIETPDSRHGTEVLLSISFLVVYGQN